MKKIGIISAVALAAIIAGTIGIMRVGRNNDISDNATIKDNIVGDKAQDIIASKNISDKNEEDNKDTEEELIETVKCWYNYHNGVYIDQLYVDAAYFDEHPEQQRTDINASDFDAFEIGVTTNNDIYSAVGNPHGSWGWGFIRDVYFTADDYMIKILYSDDDFIVEDIMVEKIEK